MVRIAWQIVFGVGIAVLAGGGLLLARAYSREGAPGVTWGWVAFVLGLLVLLLGWWLQRARWFYLSVREHDGGAFTIALPLPLGLVVGLLRVAEPFVPQLRGVEADQLILAMRDELENDRSFVISVDEGEEGDQVEMYFC
jgi:H+/Cl- antiporter ClcA